MQCLYKGFSVYLHMLDHMSEITWATESQFVLLSSDSQRARGGRGRETVRLSQGNGGSCQKETKTPICLHFFVVRTECDSLVLRLNMEILASGWQWIAQSEWEMHPCFYCYFLLTQAYSKLQTNTPSGYESCWLFMRTSQMRELQSETFNSYFRHGLQAFGLDLISISFSFLFTKAPLI